MRPLHPPRRAYFPSGFDTALLAALAPDQQQQQAGAARSPKALSQAAFSHLASLSCRSCGGSNLHLELALLRAVQGVITLGQGVLPQGATGCAASSATEVLEGAALAAMRSKVRML